MKSVGVDNPAAKILVDMSKVQDDEVGDGTTSVTVLGKYSLINKKNSFLIIKNKVNKWNLLLHVHHILNTMLLILQ